MESIALHLMGLAMATLFTLILYLGIKEAI